MIPVHDLFESHLNVTDLQRSMSFFGQTLGLELAQVFCLGAIRCSGRPCASDATRGGIKPT